MVKFIYCQDIYESAFFASQYSVICAIPEAYSVIALRRLKEFQDSIRQHHDIAVFGVILSFWDERGAVDKEFLDEINASFPDMLFEAKVRRDVAVSRAVLKGKTVFDFDKDSRAAEDFKALTDEFIKRFSLRSPSPERFQCVTNNSKEEAENVTV